MADGAATGAAGKVGEALSGAAKSGTIDLAKDIFEQIMSGGGGSGDDPNEQAGDSTAGLQQQRMMFQAQKNARMAQIQKNIHRIRKEREKASHETKQKEQHRQKQMEEQTQVAKQQQQEGGFAKKGANMLKDMGNFIARKGKGEQRGNKIAG